MFIPVMIAGISSKIVVIVTFSFVHTQFSIPTELSGFYQICINVHGVIAGIWTFIFCAMHNSKSIFIQKRLWKSDPLNRKQYLQYLIARQDGYKMGYMLIIYAYFDSQINELVSI